MMSLVARTFPELNLLTYLTNRLQSGCVCYSNSSHNNLEIVIGFHIAVDENAKVCYSCGSQYVIIAAIGECSKFLLFRSVIV